jgi:hypothetical protein
MADNSSSKGGTAVLFPVAPMTSFPQKGKYQNICLQKRVKKACSDNVFVKTLQLRQKTGRRKAFRHTNNEIKEKVSTALRGGGRLKIVHLRYFPGSLKQSKINACSSYGAAVAVR